MEREFILSDDFKARQLLGFLKQNRRAMAESGKPLVVTVSVHKSKRSTQANRLMWDVLRQVSEQAWINGAQYPAELWHAYFAGRLLGYVTGPDGRESPISTTTLDTAQFAEYCDRVMAHAATELGCELDVGVPL